MILFGAFIKFFTVVAVVALVGGQALRAVEPATGEQKKAFREALDAAQAQSDGALSITGSDGWYFFNKELLHLLSERYWGEGVNNPLPAILDFKAQLDKAGVELLVVPVPAKAAIYPDKLSASIPSPPSTPRDLADQDAAFIEALQSHGVEVLDLTGDFLQARGGGVDTHCRTDTHWSPEGVRIAAKKIAEKVSGNSWISEQPRLPVRTEVAEIQIRGDLTPADGPIEKLPAHRVVEANVPDSVGIPDSRTSPVVLLGDSHNLVFHSGGEMHASGAGLADQLCMELGFPMDVVAVMGSGSTAARRNLARRKDNLEGKKLVIWCFSSREFTQGQGWAKVPVIKESVAPISR